MDFFLIFCYFTALCVRLADYTRRAVCVCLSDAPVEKRVAVATTTTSPYYCNCQRNSKSWGGRILEIMGLQRGIFKGLLLPLLQIMAGCLRHYVTKLKKKTSSFPELSGLFVMDNGQPNVFCFS